MVRFFPSGKLRNISFNVAGLWYAIDRSMNCKLKPIDICAIQLHFFSLQCDYTCYQAHPFWIYCLAD